MSEQHDTPTTPRLVQPQEPPRATQPSEQQGQPLPEPEPAPPPALTATDPAENNNTIPPPTNEAASSPSTTHEEEKTSEDETVLKQEPPPVTDSPAADAATEMPTTMPETEAQPAPLPYMSVDDLLALQVVSNPQCSPDGSLIAFSVLSSDGVKNTTQSHLWLVKSTASKDEPASQLTSGDQHDTQPLWSPDGTTLAFLSDRQGSSQIYLLPVQGGEPRKLSDLPQGVTSFSWRPDGQAILAHSAWGPQDNQIEAYHNDTAHVYTRLDDHHDGTGYTESRYQQLWLLPLTGEPQRLTSEPVDLLHSCWSPDGLEIAFCANRRNDPDLSTSRALWVLTVASGQLRRLTPEEGVASVPSWSPDGQLIAFLYAPDESSFRNISPWIVQVQGQPDPQPAVPAAADFTSQQWVIDELGSQWLDPPQWYPDSQTLLVPVQQRGQVHLYRLDLTQKQAAPLTSRNGRYLQPHLSHSGTTIAVIRADWFTPGDVWSMESTGQHPRKLSRANDAFLQSRQLTRPRRISWHSSDDLEIEGWLYLPTLPEQEKAPLVIAPHGGPTLAWGDAYNHEFQVLTGKGYAVLAPNPRGSAGYGEEFASKVFNDWGGGDLQDLLAGLDWVIAHEPIDAERLGIGGISYGGYMTNWAITQTPRFKAAVSRNGISSIASAALLSDDVLWFLHSMPDPDLQRQRSALSLVGRITTPLLLLHGENDLNCPFSESLQLFKLLRRRRQRVELVAYPNASHLMDWPDVGTPQQRVDRLRRTVDWFTRFV